MKWVGFFLNLKKAFDTVNHRFLQKIFENIGIRGVALDWFESYLSNRKQVVEICNTASDQHVIECGVLQVSVLGPLLVFLHKWSSLVLPRSQNNNVCWYYKATLWNQRNINEHYLVITYTIWTSFCVATFF